MTNMAHDFHQEVAVELRLGRVVESGEIYRHLRSIGFQLFYDVYAMPRPDSAPHPNWQSEELVYVDLRRGGVAVDAQESCDSMCLSYPLATIEQSLIEAFLDTVEKVQQRLGGELYLDGQQVSVPEVKERLDACVADLWKEWGLEPETTAFDLVRFPSSCGYWNNIATVLSELAEKMDPDKLAGGAERVARSDVQRLGWLLDLVEETVLADALAKKLEGERLLPTPLTSARDSADAPLDPRWRVLVNDEVEPDL